MKTEALDSWQTSFSDLQVDNSHIGPHADVPQLTDARVSSTQRHTNDDDCFESHRVDASPCAAQSTSGASSPTHTASERRYDRHSETAGSVSRSISAATPSEASETSCKGVEVSLLSPADKCARWWFRMYGFYATHTPTGQHFHLLVYQSAYTSETFFIYFLGYFDSINLCSYNKNIKFFFGVDLNDILAKTASLMYASLLPRNCAGSQWWDESQGACEWFYFKIESKLFWILRSYNMIMFCNKKWMIFRVT